MNRQPEPSLGGADRLERSSILGDERQRRVLSVLLDRSRPVTVHVLGVRVAAQEAGIEPSETARVDHGSVRADLRHRCLPKLEAVGWIERHPEGVVADEPIRPAPEGLSFPDLRDPEHPAWAAASALLARPRRQDLVSVVADRPPRVTLDELARELRARGPRWRTGIRDEGTTRGTLHHVDLPKLAEVGLVEYDADEGTVAPTSRLTGFVDRPDRDTR